MKTLRWSQDRPAAPIQLSALLMALLASGVASAQQGLPFAKKPPGAASEIFASGVVSLPDRHEYCSTISRDGRTLYFGVELGTRTEIRLARWEGDTWSDSTVFLGHERFSFGDPVLALDGQRIYFISNRPLEDKGEETKDFDIWYLDREGEGWSDPRNLGPVVNSPFDEYNTSFASSGRVYFASNRLGEDSTRNFDLFSSELRSGTYQTPEPVPGGINTRYYEADAYVSPDESLLVYVSVRPGGKGRGDLLVSRRAEDGAWSAGRPLGSEVNTAGHELCPLLIGDGRYLVYTGEQDLRWIDADALGLND